MKAITVDWRASGKLAAVWWVLVVWLGVPFELYVGLVAVALIVGGAVRDATYCKTWI
jgi:hypothetical protein